VPECEGCGRLVKEGRRFCSMVCASPFLEARSIAFGNATSSKRGKPPDGVTYGAGKKEGKG
jgi:hypothetical protein